MSAYKCPDWEADDLKEGEEQLIGCGTVFDAEEDDEGLVDCPHCGIWFSPAREPSTIVDTEQRNNAVADRYTRLAFEGRFPSSLRYPSELNAGCDRCGVDDRAPGSKYCASCGSAEAEG